MTTATHFAYNDTLGSRRRRAAEGAHLTAAGAIFQLDNVHLAFPFCFANKAQAKAEALLTGGGRGVFRAVGGNSSHVRLAAASHKSIDSAEKLQKIT